MLWKWVIKTLLRKTSVKHTPGKLGRQSKTWFCACIHKTKVNASIEWIISSVDGNIQKLLSKTLCHYLFRLHRVFFFQMLCENIVFDLWCISESGFHWLKLYPQKIIDRFSYDDSRQSRKVEILTPYQNLTPFVVTVYSLSLTPLIVSL